MKYKLESPGFAPWDAAGMTSHLEQMESRGWQFQGINWLGLWKYTPCLPASARYAVAYTPSRRNWKLMPTEAERDLEDICFDAGWRKIAALSKFHIYRNPDPDATDLDTEESVRLDTLHHAFHRDLLVSLLLSGILTLILVWALWFLCRDSLPSLLSSPALPLMFLLPIYTVLEVMVPFFLFRWWINAARQAEEQTKPSPPVRGWRPYICISRVLMLTVLAAIVASGAWSRITAYILVVIIMSIPRFILPRRAEDPEETERKYQNLRFWFAIAAFFLILICSPLLPKDSPAREQAAIPVTIGQITGAQQEPSTLILENQQGILSDYLRYRQTVEKKQLSCTFFDQRIPIFTDACSDVFREEFFRMANNAVQVDAALWNAETVYQSGNLLLILYKDRMVILSTSWSLSEAELARTAEILSR